MDGSGRAVIVTWKISREGRIEKLIVFVTMGGDPVPVGALTFEGAARRQSYFAYAKSWLARSDKFPLAPAGLALRAKAVLSAPHEVPLLFYDAAPDGWGRGVLTAAFPNQAFGMAEFLAAAGDERTGELRFGPTPDAGPRQWVPPGNPMLALPDDTEDLAALERAAQAADIGEATSDHLRLLFRSSADVGGARPKARVRRNGQPWIAKFRAWGDSFDDPRMEAVCLSLAEACKIRVPEHDRIEIAGRSVLLVRRFDRTAAGARRGVMSAATLMGQEPTRYHTDASYADVAARAREAGVRPCEADLYRRLLFNAFIHNTDDHLRNHAFIRGGEGGEEDGNEVWRLSPAFDLVPNRSPRMVLRPARGLDPLPDPAAILGAHAAFRLSRPEAETILEEIVTGLAALPALLDRHAVSARDRTTVAELMPLAFRPPSVSGVSRGSP